MGLFTPITNLFKRNGSLENPSTSLRNPAQWLSNLFGNKGRNGQMVTLETAMTVSAMWACWRIISETIASLSLEVMRVEGDNIVPAKDHPLYYLLNKEPSPLYTSLTWRETMQLHALAHGTAYAKILRNGLGEIIELRFVPTGDVEVIVPKGENEPVYRIRTENKTYRLTEMLAVPVMSFNGIAGSDMLAVAREILAESLAAGEFGANYLGNGAMLSGIITYDGELAPEARERLVSSWKRKYEGSANAGTTALLEYGMKYTPISGSAQDSQLLELRKFYIEDVARFYNISPAMIGALENATLNNVESLSINFVRFTMRPYIKRWEQELNRKLFMPSERNTYYVRFNMDSLLRGDTEARAEYYNKLFQVGALSPNDIRRLENMNPIDDGDKYYRPLNFNPLDEPINEETNEQ